MTIEDQIVRTMMTLGWTKDDDIRVEVGGMSVTGTATNPNGNPKWSKPFGTVTYQHDAFIVIKNKTRNPVISSKPCQ